LSSDNDEALVQEYRQLREQSKDERAVVLATLPVRETAAIQGQNAKPNYVRKWAEQYREHADK
jgi:hypothetical protein